MTKTIKSGLVRTASGSAFRLAAALLLTVSFVFSQEFEKIKDVNVKASSADRLDVIIDMTAPANYYLFKMSDPPRLVIEFTSASVEATKREIDVKNSFIKKVRVGQYKDAPIKIARIVFDLPSDEVYYDALTAGSQILVAISSKEDNASVKMPDMIKPQKTAAARSSIERNVPTPDHKSKVQEIKEGGEEAVAPESTVKVVDAPGKMSTHGGVLQISQKIISVNFYQTDIRTILRAVAEQTGINIIYGPDVQGNVTLRLNDVSFDDALRIILKMSGLVVEKEADNIIRIITPQALRDERSRSVQFTRVMPLKYTRAEDIEKQLSAIKVEGIAATLGSDPLTNSIVLTTTPEGISKYQELISIFDVKPRQVLIEASIMEVDYSDGLDLGIAWQMSGFNVYNKDANNLVQGAVQNSPAATPVAATGRPALNTTSIGLSLAVGGLINSNQFSALIDALQQKRKAKTLATPKIVTMNNVKATIMSGDKVPYAQTTVTTAGSTQATEFTDVGIQLDVTPTIHSDEYVTLEVKPTVSSYKMSTAGPIITTREASTTVMVKSNETVVIGGLINETDLEAVDQMPILGDLPILGYLFKRHQQSTDRVELLVFLKPIILD